MNYNEVCINSVPYDFHHFMNYTGVFVVPVLLRFCDVCGPAHIRRQRRTEKDRTYEQLCVCCMYAW